MYVGNCEMCVHVCLSVGMYVCQGSMRIVCSCLSVCRYVCMSRVNAN